MKHLLSFCLLLCFACAPSGDASAQGPKKNAGQSRPKPAAKRPAGAPLSDDELKAKLDAAFKLAPTESVKELESLVKSNPRSPLLPRALELLTAARAALGDERLKAGDTQGGVELFRRALADAPAEMPDRLFYEVVAQLPANLFLRGQHGAAMELARSVEERAKTDAKRLVAVAGFYLNVEQPEEAARVATAAAALAPDSAPAHLALGAAHRISLQLDKAAEAYKRALELDPKSTVARRSLADLQRASGRAEDALALYRELLASDPKDQPARAGLVLSLFDAGRREEAERELEAALQESPTNLPLLVGAAWSYVTRGDARRAEELARRAVSAEPRYTWAQIVLARSLVAQKRPLEAEAALRFARQYGRFPTLDYELANALAAAGLYEEAAEELARSFKLKDGKLETKLAGRAEARAESFVELLAPERRASIFQHAPADTEANARTLRNLLAFHLVMREVGGPVVHDKESGAKEAAAFAEGEDEMRAFRQLYAASRLVKYGVGIGVAQRLVESAMSHADAALAVPHANLALLADDIRDVRERALASGSLPAPPEVPAHMLSNVMRGRIEDLAGWSLFIEGKPAEAVVRLKRAASVLPENSGWWRAAVWHLGAAQDATGDQKEALASYLKSYNRRAPDPARRAIIEGLYRRVHGSLEGLDERIGPAPPGFISTAATTTTLTPDAPATTTSVPTTTAAAVPSATTTTTPATTDAPAPVSSPTTTNTPAREATTTSDAQPAVKSEPTPETKPAPDAPPAQTSKAEPQPSPTPETAAPPAETPAPAGEPKTETESKEAEDKAPARRRTVLRAGGAGSGGDCSLSLSEESVSVAPGGSASVSVSLGEGGDLTAVKATTSHWSDIMVLAAKSLGGYTVSSISRKEGTYAVNFTSPCGAKTLTVNVK